MNFDNDDPLGDLSYGSNDSFFEEPKVLAKRASLTKPPDKKTISDLFGFEDKNPIEKSISLTKSDSDWLGLDQNEESQLFNLSKTDIKSSKSLLTNKSVKKISFEDDDLLDTLGIEKKADNKNVQNVDKEKSAETSKKSALMESLFGPSKLTGSKTSSFDDILGESKLKRDKAEEVPSKNENIANKEPDTPLDEQKGYTFSNLDISREGRRSRPQTSKLDFTIQKQKNFDDHDFKSDLTNTGENKVINKPPIVDSVTSVKENSSEYPLHIESKTKSAPNIKTLPDWLGPKSPAKTNKSEVIITKPGTPASRRNSVGKEDIKIKQHITPEHNVNLENVKSDTEYDNPALETLFIQQKLSASNAEYQNTATALQQQESQLLIALQLKKYEENLSEMHRKQQEVLIKQEQQFNQLLDRQFAKQQIMENNIKLQQERINNHLQLLISQPVLAGNKPNEEDEKNESIKKSNKEENSRLYENMILSLKERHREEIFLVEESYKKQISLLENTMSSFEERLTADAVASSERYKELIDRVNREHQSEIDKYHKKIDQIAEEHFKEIKNIRQDHERILEEIKYEYSNLIDNFKQIKQSESDVKLSAQEYTTKLDDNLQTLSHNTNTLNEIQRKVQQDYGVLSIAREETLKAKEEEIRLMRSTVEKSKQAAESERAQLMSLVRSLELKLVEQNQNTREEKWAFEQATAVLVARSAALDRESAFNQTSLEREREQLKTLKETMLAEQEKIILQLTEEKLSLSAERSRLETSAKLNQNFDSQKNKAEVDAAIQVAKEAAEKTDHERQKLQRQQFEIESFKRNLLEREKILAMRENEIDMIVQNADRKFRDGEKALLEAKSLEMKYNERLREIQNQVLLLSNREKKLAEEKISLSKERLSLHGIQQNKPCSLCVVERHRHDEEDNYNFSNVDQDISKSFNVADPEILRLRYEIKEDNRIALNDYDNNSM